MSKTVMLLQEQLDFDFEVIRKKVLGIQEGMSELVFKFDSWYSDDIFEVFNIETELIDYWYRRGRVFYE